MLPVQSHALSCAPWSIERVLAQTSASNTPYVIVLGTLAFDTEKLPRVDISRQDATPASTLIPARFRGERLMASGAAEPFDHGITLDVRCTGPWCGRVLQGKTLAFVEVRPEGFVLVQDPCGTLVIARPDSDVLTRLNTLLSGGD